MAKVSRRSFLKRSLALGAGAVLMVYSDGSYKLSFAQGDPPVYSLRLIHTNDHHGRLEPQLLSDPVTLREGDTSVTRLFGGVARRKTLFDQFRAEAVAGSQNILFLDAGDVFQGTLYFNLFQGQADLDFYIDLGYDALTIGNHEFDKGPQALVDFIKGVKDTGGAITKPTNFPVVSANITATDAVLAPALTTGAAVPGSKIGQYTIIDKGGKKIGIFGLTTPETKVSSSPGAGIDFADPIETAKTVVPALRAAGADYVIALTHIGYALDQELARQVNGIDLIIGGHSHTPLLPSDMTTVGNVGVTKAGDYATVVNNPDGKPTLIVTDWEWGKWIGDITIGFDATGQVSQIEGTVHPVWADILPKSETPRTLIDGEKAPIAENTSYVTKLKPYKDQIEVLNTQKIGETDFLLEGGSGQYRTRETSGGDLITDAMLARAKAFSFPDNKPADIAITNSGGIRAVIQPGDITVGSVITVLPFGNTLATVDLTGAQVIAALENGVSQVQSVGGRFPQVSGLRFHWNKGGTPAMQKDEVPGREAQKGQRIVSVEIQKADGSYEPIDLAKVYRVVTNNFMVGGGDGYFVFTSQGDQADPAVGGGTNQYDTQLILADVVQDYIAANTPLQRPAGGRIIGVVAILPIVIKEAEPATQE